MYLSRGCCAGVHGTVDRATVQRKQRFVPGDSGEMDSDACDAPYAPCDPGCERKSGARTSRALEQMLFEKN